jgi:hypothetical protein
MAAFIGVAARTRPRKFGAEAAARAEGRGPIGRESIERFRKSWASRGDCADATICSHMRLNFHYRWLRKLRDR